MKEPIYHVVFIHKGERHETTTKDSADTLRIRIKKGITHVSKKDCVIINKKQIGMSN